jgi:predicted DNA binding CopG/RHH family protein
MNQNLKNSNPVTLEEFDEWSEENDLGKFIEIGASVPMPGLKERSAGRPRIGKKITLILPEEAIEDLRRRAKKKGMGYQTFARMVLMELPPDEDRKTGS